MNEHNRDYVSGHDILKGRMTEDWVDENLSLKEIQSMIYPDEKLLDKIGYKPIFLGYYIQWDATINNKIATDYGFKIYDKEPIMGLYNFADLDSTNIVIHHYFKWLKFGFNRITD